MKEAQKEKVVLEWPPPMTVMGHIIPDAIERLLDSQNTMMNP